MIAFEYKLLNYNNCKFLYPKFTINAKGTLYRKHLESDTKPAAFKDCETGELYQSIYARILIKKKN